MSIVTKQGDGGKTRLYSGEEVSKSDERLDTYGTLDELVSFLGLARSFCSGKIKTILLNHQQNLFRLGTELATASISGLKLNPINQNDVETIEDLIVDIETKTKLPRHFIIPGSTKLSSTLDISRAVCRRFERLLVSFFETGAYNNKAALIFINRLSDLLFLLARKVEK